MVKRGTRQRITTKAAKERKIRLFRGDQHRRRNHGASRYRLVRSVRVQTMRLVRWGWWEALGFVRGVRVGTKSQVAGADRGKHRAAQDARNPVAVVGEALERGVGVLRSEEGGKGRCGRERLLRGKGS